MTGSTLPATCILAVSLEDFNALKTATLTASICATGDSRPPAHPDPFLETVPLIETIWAEETLTLENPLALVAQLETDDCSVLSSPLPTPLPTTSTKNKSTILAMEDESWSLFDGFDSWGHSNPDFDKIPATFDATDMFTPFPAASLNFSDVFEEDRLGLALESYMELNEVPELPENPQTRLESGHFDVNLPQLSALNTNLSPQLRDLNQELRVDLNQNYTEEQDSEVVCINDWPKSTATLQDLLRTPSPNNKRPNPGLNLNLHSKPKKLKLEDNLNIPIFDFPKNTETISTPDVTNVVLELENGQNFDLLSYISEDFDTPSVGNTDSGVNSPACSTPFSRPSSRATPRRNNRNSKNLYDKESKSPGDLVTEARERNNEASRKSRQNKKKREVDNHLLIERLERNNKSLIEDEKILQALIARVKKAMIEAVGNKPDLLAHVQDLDMGSSSLRE